MSEATSWDRPATSRELESHCGTPKTYTTRKLIIETITKTVRCVDSRILSVPYAKTNSSGSAYIAAYSLSDVVKDYGTEPKPLQALMAVLEGSDCPLVSAWRMAMANLVADQNATDVDEVLL